MTELKQADRDLLESILDRTTVYGLLSALSGICEEKHDHIKANWQDRVTAQPWADASAALDKFALTDPIQRVSR